MIDYTTMFAARFSVTDNMKKFFIIILLILFLTGCVYLSTGSKVDLESELLEIRARNSENIRDWPKEEQERFYFVLGRFLD